MKEDQLQIAVATYLDYTNRLWCHVANERRTTPARGGKLKKMGVKSGVPDCLIFEAMGGYNGLAIELKVGRNKPTENQIIWHERLRAKGWYVAICYTLQDVIEVTEAYFNNLFYSNNTL